jgi:3-oxoacyl-[acyl-carrier protein] reductase
MSDFLVELGANRTARTVIERLGLPLPIPQKLDRADGAWEARPLDGKTVLVGAAPGSTLSTVIARTLAESGAGLLVEGDVGAGTPWQEAGEAWGRSIASIGAGAAPESRVHAIVFDASGIDSVDAIASLHTFFQPRIKSVSRNGRVVVIGRIPSEAKEVEVVAVRRALEGFIRALAKETGGKGTTSNLLLVSDKADEAVAGPLRWLLSKRSAFFTGQPIVVAGGKAPAQIAWTLPLDRKVAVVTGAARGIGEATATALAREGAHVLCLDRPADADALGEVARRIGGTAVAVDVTAADAADRILEAAKAHGGLDIIVHNAGVTRDKTLGNMDRERWDMTFDINLRAILNLTDALAPHLRAHGRVIALSSVAGIAGNFGQTNYAASKAGVIGFLDAAAPKLAKRNITVNGIAPGFIETRLTAAIPAATREAGRRLSALVQGGLPIDIAEAIVFLASPGSYGITGRVVRVCGGAFIGA